MNERRKNTKPENWQDVEKKLRPDLPEDELYLLLMRYVERINADRNVFKGQSYFLRTLYHMGPMSQRELQAHLGIQAGSMSEVALKLEKKGLIVREKSPEDRRRILLSLTPAGKRTLDDYREHHPYRYGNLDVLNETEQQQLQGLLKKLLENDDV